MRGDFFLFFHGHIVADIGRKEKPCFLFFAAAYTGMSAMLNAKKEETHLEKNDTAVKICGTTEGRLPGSCAPLAFPYVPVQCDNPARYSQQDALQAGTLFPGLNLPFHADMETRFPAANTALSELMALDFAIDETIRRCWRSTGRISSSRARDGRSIRRSTARCFRPT